MRVFVLVRSLRGDTAVALCVCDTFALAQSSAQRHVEQLAAEASVPPVQIAWTRVRAPTWLPWWQVEASAWHGAPASPTAITRSRSTSWSPRRRRVDRQRSAR